MTDQVAALKDDVASIQEYPLLPKDIEVVGAIFDVNSGALNRIPSIFLADLVLLLGF